VVQETCEILAAMLKLCLRGQQGSAVFTFFDPHRLSWELEVLLAKEGFTNRRVLTLKANRLWVHNAKHSCGGRHRR
jgi:hypothetical protein